MTRATLNRTTFRTSREMDFFSEKELTTQTGHPMQEWPYVIVKELVDNSLDACEEADVSPEIRITADAGGITVTDNGPGIPGDTIEGSLDFTVRVSNREQYVAPDRGAQGNALKTLLAMPSVLDPEAGKIVITSHGVRHEIACRADPISQRPVVEDTAALSNGQIGTEVRIQWAERSDEEGNVVWPFDGILPTLPNGEGNYEIKDKVLDLVLGYAFFNPHLSLAVDWFDEPILDVEATDPEWVRLV